jgi:hypothetical protein
VNRWSAGVALVAALALAPAVRARAAEPELTVAVSVVGTPEDLDRARGLAIARPLADRISWRRQDTFDPEAVLADAGASTEAVRAWIDVTDARHARLYFATRSGERFLLRDVRLSGRFDEVDRAALAEVLELSIGVLLEDERAGLTRDEARALLASREPFPPPPVAPLEPPPPPRIPSRWAAGVFYGAQTPAGESPVAHGPGLLLSFAHDLRGQQRGQGLLFWLAGQWNTLDTAGDGARIAVGLDTIAARAGIEIGSDSGVGLRIGAGADVVHIAPRAPAPDPSIALAPARWSSHFIVSAAARVNLSVIGPVRLAGLFALDLAPTAVSYDVSTNGMLSPVFSPSRLRPGIVLELHAHRTR